ncbi:MAG: hypothetical protein Sapg2KO_44620 [Saprospiraceae bacterium]|mgnify:CR=1 FL=1
MKKLITFSIFLSLFVLQLSAQSNPTDKVSGALTEFMQTEFMRQFGDLRIKAEAEIGAFATNSSSYDPQDVARVQTAYDRTAQRFNSLLDKIKQDFLDTKKLKYITRYPDSYSRGLELDIRELSDFYSQNLQQTLADVTNNQQDGSALLLLLVDLVKFSSTAIQHFNRIRQEARRYTDSYLVQHFIKPNRFKSWAELSGNGSFNDPYADPFQQNQTTDPYADPYQQNQTDPYADPFQQNQNTTTDPYQQNQTDPYNDPYQQNQNTDPFGLDGQARPDSLSQISKDSSKVKTTDVIIIPKTVKKDSSKVKTAPYDIYKKDQRKKIQEKKNTKKNN